MRIAMVRKNVVWLYEWGWARYFQSEQANQSLPKFWLIHWHRTKQFACTLGQHIRFRFSTPTFSSFFKLTNSHIYTLIRIIRANLGIRASITT
jgi:hypothetical protein